MQYFAPALLSFIVLLAVYFSSFATYYAYGSDVLENNQKRAIYLLAWLVPLIGPVIVISALRDEFARQMQPTGPVILQTIFFWQALSAADDQRDRAEASHIGGTDLSPGPDFGDSGGGGGD